MTVTIAEKIAARRATCNKKAVNKTAEFRADTFRAAFVALAAYTAGVVDAIESHREKGYEYAGISASASAVYRYAKRLQKAPEEQLETPEGIVNALEVSQGKALNAVLFAIQALNCTNLSAHDIIEVEDYR